MSEKFCPNCGSKLSEKDKFCDQCGHEISLEKAAEKKSALQERESPPDSFSETYKQIVSHLEFLGYTLKYFDAETEAGKKVALALHDKHGAIFCNEIEKNLIFMQITWNTEKKPNTLMSQAVNAANQATDLFKVYYVTEDGHVKIRFETFYCGEYTKASFGKFHEILLSDQQRAFAQEDFNKAFLK